MVTDFHTHILPGIDDGSQSLEDSLSMLRLMARQGIGHVVATPHFYAGTDSLPEFLARRDQAEAQLRQAAAQLEELPQLSVGAEVFFFRGMSESELLPQLTIRGKSCILIEMPPPPWGNAVYRELEEIWQKWGFTPVIAHIERYIGPFRTRGMLRRLGELPVLIQSNASFFLEPATAGTALGLLRQGHIHLLGSDCHNLTTRRPNLGEAMARIEKKLGPQALEQISRCAADLLE